MKCLTLQKINAPLTFEERDDLQPGPGQVVVRLKAAALNRRDYWISLGMYPGIELPVIPGSDGAGTVSACGKGVDPAMAGREVILDPGMNWGDSETHQSPDYTILGLPQDGTFATEVLVSESQLHSRPKHLTWNEAAALPLAGVTAFRAVFSQGGLKSGENVLITGIGGGVATLALQFGVAAGANVWVTSSSAEKIARAIELGAKGGFDYTSEGWWKEMSKTVGPPDLIIDSAGGKGWGALLSLAAPGGRVVNFGATAGPPEKVDLFRVFWKQLRILGSTMGSPSDFRAMLDFTEKHKIQPLIDDVSPLADGSEILARMKSSPQFGKFVLHIAD